MKTAQPSPPRPLCLRRRRKPVMLFSQSKLLLTLLLTILDFFHTFCLSQNVIEYLPGFPGKLPFKLETGYIGLGEMEEVQLFYYFFASERNPEEDPLVLWLTGGPGCSSLYGITSEIGPFTIEFLNSNGSLPSLMLKEHAWTKVANIIFLDQPVGTGFSYATTPEAFYSNDTYATELNYEFLRKWLISHPKYINNPLYIGGDSYSGITVPLVANNVYRGNEAGIKPLMNIKGYVLGNPYTDAFGEANAVVPCAHRMGLLSDRLYNSAKVNCHGNYVNVDPENILCLNDLERINQCLDKINTFMILEPLCDSVWRAKEDVLSLDISFSEEIPTNFLQSIVAPVKKIICRNAPLVLLHTWANNKSVQQALDIREGTKEEWERCNNTIKSSARAPDRPTTYVANVKSVFGYHQDFTHKNCRTLIYSGDHDLFFPHTSTEKWIESLKVPILSDWRPWFVQGQIAGYTMTYGHGDYELTYATVKGAGHTAPEFKPEECFAMITRWFEKSSL
ncbi:Serine carboxypeptidases (lysosomal cathepsin A) [Handroanthus impetiginosus]|uniref:Serine carboxypeptidases (Lysosomal cathepsin A) n=1 Tax=Handroanthus impetiginosus TaxID=429701 RepID=A0A2G9HZW3_9LAMI|nr:Serine carboxypeptidases (lysosomal cathepsin A) [Handroanthus impetiginosus]